jgi:hypothetical protein
MPKHTVLLSVNASTGQVAGQKDYTGELETVMDVPVPAPSTNLEADVNIDVSAVKSIELFCDRDITVKTNSSGSPIDTINLKANVPYIWTTDSYDTLKLTADVTKFFLTLASGVAATFKLRVITDPTP